MNSLFTQRAQAWHLGKACRSNLAAGMGVHIYIYIYTCIQYTCIHIYIYRQIYLYTLDFHIFGTVCQFSDGADVALRLDTIGLGDTEIDQEFFSLLLFPQIAGKL